MACKLPDGAATRFSWRLHQESVCARHPNAHALLPPAPPPSYTHTIPPATPFQPTFPPYPRDRCPMVGAEGIFGSGFLPKSVREHPTSW
jgi:hypothetical protein